MTPDLAPYLIAGISLLLLLCLRWCVRHWSTEDVVSQEWRLEQQRREMSAGIEQSCICWSTMKALARERGVI